MVQMAKMKSFLGIHNTLWVTRQWHKHIWVAPSLLKWIVLIVSTLEKFPVCHSLLFAILWSFHHPQSNLSYPPWLLKIHNSEQCSLVMTTLMYCPPWEKACDWFRKCGNQSSALIDRCQDQLRPCQWPARPVIGSRALIDRSTQKLRPCQWPPRPVIGSFSIMFSNLWVTECSGLKMKMIMKSNPCSVSKTDCLVAQTDFKFWCISDLIFHYGL